MKTLFDEQKPRAAFKKTFGWELPERGDDVPPHNVFLKFDAKKLSALFDRIYVKPTDTSAAPPRRRPTTSCSRTPSRASRARWR